MSMYAAMFGENANSDEVLAVIGLTRDDFYRYRDCWVEDDGKVAVYTRGGGGNRECWRGASDGCDDSADTHAANCTVTMQSRLREHPLYYRDVDDDFDCTYATFYFRAPSADVLALRGDDLRGEKAWPALFAALEAWTAPKKGT